MTHTHNPEFDEEFYISQNILLEKRCEFIFKKNKIPWKKHIKDVKNKLMNNNYLLWVFLFGLENSFYSIKSKNKKEFMFLLKKETDKRILHIIGDIKSNIDYLNSL